MQHPVETEKTTERKRMSVSQIMNEDLAEDLKEQKLQVSCSSDGMSDDDEDELINNEHLDYL